MVKQRHDSHCHTKTKEAIVKDVFFSTGQFNAFALIRHHCTASSPLTVAPGGNTQTLWTSFGGLKFLLLHEGVNPNMRRSVKGSCAPICSHSAKHPRQLGLSYEGVKHLNKIWIFQLHFKTHNKYFFLGEVIWDKSYINCGLTELYCRGKRTHKTCLFNSSNAQFYAKRPHNENNESTTKL